MNNKFQQIHIIGIASCYGAQDLRCADAPLILQQLNLAEILSKSTQEIHWDNNIHPTIHPISEASRKTLVLNVCKQLATQTHQLTLKNQKFVVIGGDHSCAIGTWSGVYAGLPKPKDFGLIWIDAHMDSHTPETSPSQAIHGMPVAALLGFGDPSFCHIEGPEQKIKPQNLCLIGIRSFEPAEANLLNKLGVKIFYMQDVQKLGIKKTLQLAKEHVSNRHQPFGISIDLDAIDPKYAPGVGSPAQNGIQATELIDALDSLHYSNNFLGIEITELNSHNDRNNKTAKLAIKIIQTIVR